MATTMLHGNSGAKLLALAFLAALVCGYQTASIPTNTSLPGNDDDNGSISQLDDSTSTQATTIASADEEEPQADTEIATTAGTTRGLPLRLTSESLCVKLCLVGPNFFPMASKELAEQERIRQEEEAFFQSLTPDEQRQARCTTARRMTKCLRQCPPHTSPISTSAPASSSKSGEGTARQVRQGPLKAYFLTEFYKLQRTICGSGGSGDGVEAKDANSAATDESLKSNFWESPEFAQQLENCRFLLAYANEKHIAAGGDKQTCTITSNKAKKGAEICEVVDKCAFFLEEFCGRDVAAFFTPIMKLEIAIAEVFNDSEMPPRQCTKWFSANKALIKEEGERAREEEEKNGKYQGSG